MKTIIKFSFVIVFIMHCIIFGMEKKKSIYKKTVSNVEKHLKSYIKNKKKSPVQFFFNEVPSSIELNHFCKDHKQMYIEHWWSLDQLFNEYNPILSVNFNSGYYLTAGAINGMVSIIDVKNKKKIQYSDCDDQHYYNKDFNNIYFYSSKNRLTLESNNNLSLVDLQTFEKYSNKSVQEIMPDIKGNVYSAHFDSAHNRLALGMHNGMVILFDVQKKEEIISFKFNNNCICTVCFDFLGKNLAVGLTDGSLCVIDMETKDLKLDWKTSNYYILSVNFDRASRYVAAGSSDSNIYIYDFETLEKKVIQPDTLTYKDWINSVCFDSTGNYLLCGTSNNAVNIINIHNNNTMILQHNDSVHSVCFDFDSFLATGSTNGEIRVYYWFKYHSLFQLMLRKIMNLWWQVKCPNKKVYDINSLFIDIAKLFNLNKKKLKAIWKTFPENMQLSMWSAIHSKIQRYGKYNTE